MQIEYHSFCVLSLVLTLSTFSFSCLLFTYFLIYFFSSLMLLPSLLGTILCLVFLQATYWLCHTAGLERCTRCTPPGTWRESWVVTLGLWWSSGRVFPYFSLMWPCYPDFALTLERKLQHSQFLLGDMVLVVMCVLKLTHMTVFSRVIQPIPHLVPFLFWVFISPECRILLGLLLSLCSRCFCFVLFCFVLWHILDGSFPIWLCLFAALYLPVFQNSSQFLTHS